MQTSSLRHADELNEDTFDDDPDNPNDHLNHSSVDVKLRRPPIESNTYPILHRALSTVSANQTLANNQRNLLAKNYRRTSINDEIVTIDHNDADASFLLPNLYELPEEIRIRVMDSLVDTPTMVSLEETKRLNWWIEKKLPCPKLYPLLTSGDGNCLLHATSLAMWGFHDHSLSMRKALNETLITSKPNNALYRRWRWTQSVQNKKYGLVFSEQEWNEEWKSLLRLSSAEPRTSQTKSSNSSELIPSMDELNSSKSAATITATNAGGSTKCSSQSTRQYYESLEEFHVYVLANNIRRPIVVFSDTILRTNDGEAISPIEFGGLYLPLEIPPDKCHKQPVFLAFDAAHFSALVPMEANSKSLLKVTFRIPLIDIDTLDLLPIHFLIDPGLDFAWPIDEELSDEKIQLYSNSGENRLRILEKYLSLSKESLPFHTGVSHPSTHEEISSTIEPVNNSSVNSESTTDSNATSTPTPTKKLSRPSFNSFSKIIRRTFMQPFSSGKRMSLKHQNQQQQQQQQSHQQTSIDTSDSLAVHENFFERRQSSPLLNRRTNMLTIIMAHFQPKRPKTSDNMIKNYIDACLNDYRIEKMKKQLNEISAHENDQVPMMKSYTNNTNGKNNFKSINNYSDWTENSSSYHSSGSTHRHYQSSTNQYRPEVPLTNVSTSPNGKGNDIVTSRRQLPSVPTNNLANKTALLTRYVQKSYDIDENEDFLPIENGPFSTSITYVQPSQRKSNQLIQSNSFDMASDHHHHHHHHHHPSYVNGYLTDYSSMTNRSSQKILPLSLKRQQSISSDQNSINPSHYETSLTDNNVNIYLPTSNNINKRTQQINLITNGNSRSHQFDSYKHF